MTVVGVTRHSTITRPSFEPVRDEIHRLLLPRAQRLTGMNCLARGADQVFDDVVLALHGELHIVVPAHDYFSGIPDAASRERCADYLRQAR